LLGELKRKRINPLRCFLMPVLGLIGQRMKFNAKTWQLCESSGLNQ
jgi:hypothetical protein